MSTYSRKDPSPRLRELLTMYGSMHEHGEAFLGKASADTFPGISLALHIERIKLLIQRTGAQNVLDYGAGKGQLYGFRNKVFPGHSAPVDSIQDYWDVDYVELYDPAYPPHSRRPTGRYDGVISTDVMEHLPEEDLPWILDEIFGYADKFVFLAIASYPADKRLPNGDNAHITIRPPPWWADLLDATACRHPKVLWQAHVDVRWKDDAGAYRREEHLLTRQGVPE